MMKRSRIAALAAGVASLAMLGVVNSGRADDDGKRNSFRATLRGFAEVPAVSSTGTGTFKAKIVDDERIDFVLTYQNLEGTTTTQAHVHLGNKSDAGGVSYFLCGGGTKPTPCPNTAGTVTGTVVAADVIGPTGQGIAPAEFAEVLRAMRKGVTYANVHTNKHPGGEIRGQIKPRGDGDDDDDDD